MGPIPSPLRERLLAYSSPLFLFVEPKTTNVYLRVSFYPDLEKAV